MVTDVPSENVNHEDAARLAVSERPLPGGLPAWTENAVLIYGPRKAGTTLLTNLLDGGEEIVVKPGETKLKLIAKYSPGDHFLTGYLESLKSSDFNPEELRPWPKATFEENIFSIFQGIKDKPERPRMWAMKEVGGNLRNVLKVFRTHFPYGKVIMITRDAKQITRSVLNERRRRGVRLSYMGILNEAIDPIRVLKKQEKLRGQKDVHFVSYERLVSGEIRLEMAAIAEFLGVEYSKKFEKPTIFGKSVVVKTSSRDSTEVFPNKQEWSHGLTIREKVCVRVVHFFRNCIV